MLIPVVLAGGLGTRLWPLSREAHPKQFISFLEGKSLFQHTLERISYLDKCQNPIVLANEQHRFLVAEQMRQCLQEGTILLEPTFKGTAAAIALAAVHALRQHDQDVLLLVLPADQIISEGEGFAETVQAGMTLAQQDKLVTFGVKPTHPEIGYGYIQKGAPVLGGFKIAQFVEKPKATLAKQYMESGEYWWNSGLFLFSAAVFLQELLLHAPGIYHAAKSAVEEAQRGEDFIRPDSAFFEKSPVDSIDYAVMENTENGVVLPLQSTWSDVGVWDALADFFPKDLASNVCIGDVVAHQTQDCFIQATQRLVVAVGLKKLIIVETQDAVLVLDEAHAQEMKPLVAHLREKDRKEVIFHRRVNRPWGAFELIDKGERFQVKRITVAVGGKLSLQRHHHRSEHWVVVKGTARVTRGDEIFLLSENQSTYIPIGVNHRLENVGKIPLEMIEVQSGAYLGEDDIFRLEDQYGRLEEPAISS